MYLNLKKIFLMYNEIRDRKQLFFWINRYLIIFCDVIKYVFFLIGGYLLGLGLNLVRFGGFFIKDCVVILGFEYVFCYVFIQDNGGLLIDVLVNFFYICSYIVYFLYNL